MKETAKLKRRDKELLSITSKIVPGLTRSGHQSIFRSREKGEFQLCYGCAALLHIRRAQIYWRSKSCKLPDRSLPGGEKNIAKIGTTIRPAPNSNPVRMKPTMNDPTRRNNSSTYTGGMGPVDN